MWLTLVYLFSRLTAQQRRAWPITMRQSCRDDVRRDSRKSTTCSKYLRPRFSSCRRFVRSHLQLVETDAHTLRFTNHNCFYACVFPGGPASTQRGWADGLASWIALPHLPPLPRHPHGGHPRGREASEHPVPFQHQQRQVQNTKKISSTSTDIKQTKFTSPSHWQYLCLYSGW